MPETKRPRQGLRHSCEELVVHMTLSRQMRIFLKRNLNVMTQTELKTILPYAPSPPLNPAAMAWALYNEAEKIDRALTWCLALGGRLVVCVRLQNVVAQERLRDLRCQWFKAVYHPGFPVD